MPENILLDEAQYGEAVLEDNTRRALAIIPEKVFNISETFDKADVLTQWFRNGDKIFLSVFWPKEKTGLIFPFLKEQKELISLIIEKKSLAIGNSAEEKQLLVLDVLREEPLEWIKEGF